MPRSDRPALLPDAAHRELELPGRGRIHCVEAGSGPALVLVHGGHGSWTHWVANIEPLSRSLRVIVPDLPGFGRSFEPEPAYGLDDYAGTLADLLEALGVERATLAGFSFGCLVCAAAARAEPARFGAVALVNPPGVGPRSPQAQALQRDHTRLAVHRGLRAGAVASLRDLQLFDASLIDDDVVDLLIANVRATRFVSRALSGSTPTDVLLGQLRQPVLHLIGREDVHQRHGLAGTLARMAEVAPRARIHIVEAVRHWLQFERPALFNDLVAEMALAA